MTTNTQPTDTEMLDWMAKKEACISENWGKYHLYAEGWVQSGNFSNLRAAIAAAMAKEAK